MQPHELKRRQPLKSAQPRVGRGGKRGYSCGRGQKGQTSRAGHRIRPAQRDLILRLPKRRGYNNLSWQTRAQVVSIGDLARLGGLEVTPTTLKAAGLIRYSNQPIKILAGGKTDKALVIKKIAISTSARTQIEQAGGRVEK